jgi:hypothetical protein
MNLSALTCPAQINLYVDPLMLTQFGVMAVASALVATITFRYLAHKFWWMR